MSSGIRRNSRDRRFLCLGLTSRWPSLTCTWSKQTCQIKKNANLSCVVDHFHFEINLNCPLRSCRKASVSCPHQTLDVDFAALSLLRFCFLLLLQPEMLRGSRLAARVPSLALHLWETTFWSGWFLFLVRAQHINHFFTSPVLRLHYSYCCLLFLWAYLLEEHFIFF